MRKALINEPSKMGGNPSHSLCEFFLHTGTWVRVFRREGRSQSKREQVLLLKSACAVNYDIKWKTRGSSADGHLHRPPPLPIKWEIDLENTRPVLTPASHHFLKRCPQFLLCGHVCTYVFKS